MNDWINKYFLKIRKQTLDNKTVPLSYRGQAQQRPWQFSVVPCSEDQAGGVAIFAIEGESDVLPGVIWIDLKNKTHTEFRV